MLFGALVALVLGCTPSHPQSTFDTLGPVAKSQLNLFAIIFWIGLVVFIAVEVGVVFVAIRFRKKKDQEGEPPQTHGNNKMEITWTVIPAIVLMLIAIPGTMTIFDNLVSPQPPEEGGMLIEASGRQWWFEFVYPELGITTANEMRIPVGEVINLDLESRDVIHSFWVPKLAGKVDMVPGNENKMWLQANETGEFFGQCAEFCGVAHANMRFRVIVMNRPDFDLWVAEQAAEALEPVDPLVQAGAELFTGPQAGCSACHTIQGSRRARGKVGPDLTHVASRLHLAAGIMNNTDDSGNLNESTLQSNLRSWITDPEKIKPGNIMSRDGAVYNGGQPANLNEEQISALVAYLMALK